MKEREEASKLFKGKRGKQLEKEIGIKSKTFTPGVGDLPTRDPTKTMHTQADVDAIKSAIAKAQTLEEIERLNQLLKSGYIPGRSDATTTQKIVQEVEEEDDDVDEMQMVDNLNGHH